MTDGGEKTESSSPQFPPPEFDLPLPPPSPGFEDEKTNENMENDLSFSEYWKSRSSGTKWALIIATILTVASFYNAPDVTLELRGMAEVVFVVSFLITRLIFFVIELFISHR
jgi:hypothetical protein